MKNWTVKEAWAAVQNGTNMEDIKELAKHFPGFFLNAAKGNFDAIVGAMPEKWTLRTLEKGFGDGAEDEADEAVTEACEVEAAEAEEATEGEGGLEAMSAKELMRLCDKRGIKVPHYGKNKQFYLDALTGAAEPAAEATEEEAPEKEADPYAGKTAMELFKLCKQRKIKAEAKQKAKYYIELLKAADVAATEDVEEDEEVPEEPVPAKKSTKAKKATKKAEKPAEPVEEEAPAAADDDDDWDI